jgi:hypothetical protein
MVPLRTSVVPLQSGDGGGLAVLLFQLLLIVLQLAGMWAVFAKADRPGWAAIVPIHRETKASASGLCPRG